MPGHKHIPMPVAAPDATDRLVMLTAASKTFNLAGTHCGNVIIPDATLRGQFAKTMMAMGISPNSFGLHAVRAAYSPEGAEWVDALCAYLEGNRALFDDGINAIPGLRSMALEATYLAWVDFSATGMTAAEFTARVEQGAQIAANHGATFGTGGESCLRFNLGTPRSVVAEAVARLQRAFGDLQ
jgi:cysteine-S-conjugate beta-lyase